MVDREAVIDVLKQCVDPEIPIDLWSLGLIYSIDLKPGAGETTDVDIIMSLTTPGCSMGNHMADDILAKLKNLLGVGESTVQVTFDPPWNPAMMSDVARERLGFDPQAPEKPAVSTSWE